MLRLSLFTLLLSTVVLTSLYAYNLWEANQQPASANQEWWQYQIVGGKTNGCLCTQRLER